MTTTSLKPTKANEKKMENPLCIKMDALWKLNMPSLLDFGIQKYITKHRTSKGIGSIHP